MRGGIFVNQRQLLDEPAGHTVAGVGVILVRNSVCRICPCRIHRTMLFIDCVVIEPGCIVRPEELQRVIVTEIDRIFRYHFLARTADDMMEIAMIAIPYDRIFGIIYTVPFTFPFAFPIASVLIQECRMNEIA